MKKEVLKKKMKVFQFHRSSERFLIKRNNGELNFHDSRFVTIQIAFKVMIVYQKAIPLAVKLATPLLHFLQLSIENL